MGTALETVARFHDVHYLTGRVELVDKDELFAAGQPLADRTFRIGAYTAGYTRDFHWIPRIATGLGSNFIFLQHARTRCTSTMARIRWLFSSSCGCACVSRKADNYIRRLYGRENRGTESRGHDVPGLRPQR